MAKSFRDALRRLKKVLQPPQLPHLPVAQSFSLSQQWILILLAGFLLCLFYFRFHSPSPNRTIADPKEIVVEVSGEVIRPGIYTFPNPPLLREVIEKAGGVKELGWLEQDTSSIPLTSGTHLTVQSHSFSSLSESESGGKRTLKIKIGTMEARKLLLYNLPLDLNRVTVEDLCLLPGIGESLAREIVTYRERRKGFRSVEELRQVKGIGEKNWKKFKPYLTVGPG